MRKVVGSMPYPYALAGVGRVRQMAVFHAFGAPSSAAAIRAVLALRMRSLY